MRVSRGATVDEEYYPLFQLKDLKQNNNTFLPPLKQQPQPQQQITQTRKVIVNNLLKFHE